MTPVYQPENPLIVQGDHTILAEVAERAEEIDARRAQEAKQRAESNLTSCNTEEDFSRTAGDLKRAETRLEVAAKGK